METEGGFVYVASFEGKVIAALSTSEKLSEWVRDNDFDTINMIEVDYGIFE